MEMTLKETCKNLRELSKNLIIKRECESFFGWSEEDYIQANIKTEEPKLKQIEEIEEIPEPTTIKEKKGWVIIVQFISSLLVGIGLMFTCVVCGLPPAPCFIAMFLPEIICVYFVIKTEKKRAIYANKMAIYRVAVKKNEENREYNKLYPVLLEKYNADVMRCKEEYNKKYEEYKEKIKKAERIISNFNGIIAPKYYGSINEIVEIIEDGRADSVKEALNIFVSDSRQRELVRAQQESNRIAEQQRQDAQRHNMAMEEQAKRQVDAIKQQEDARRSGAPNCWQCRNYPCGGNPAYCGSFIKK